MWRFIGLGFSEDLDFFGCAVLKMDLSNLECPKIFNAKNYKKFVAIRGLISCSFLEKLG